MHWPDSDDVANGNGDMRLNNLILKTGSILDVSPVKRSIVIPYMLIFVYTQYVFLDLFFFCFPSPYIDNAVIHTFKPFKISFVLIAITMVLLRHRLDRSELAQKIVPFVYTQFYLFSLILFGYVIGLDTIVAGIVIAATPLLCMLLFSDAVTVALIVSGVVTYLTVTALSVAGILPVAPLFILSAQPDMHEKLFKAAVLLFVAFPYLVAFMVGAYLLIRYWQSREDGVRRAGLTDSLTDMANRRAISDHLKVLLDQRLESTPISVILVDIDYFKSVNDSYGHATGDLVLRRVGDSLKASLRGDDNVGRFGGEEFLIVLPHTPLDIAQQIAERCRTQIEQTVILNSEHQAIRVTASFGVYCSIDPREDLAKILHAADVQLYRAKDSGRNRVCIHGELHLA